MKLLTIVFVLSLVTVTIPISAGAQTARVKAAQKASEPQPSSQARSFRRHSAVLSRCACLCFAAGPQMIMVRLIAATACWASSGLPGEYGRSTIRD